MAKSHSGEAAQFFGVRDRDRAAAERDDAVVGEVAQHARDGLAHGAGVARDLLVRGAHGRAGVVGLVPEILCEALVKAREQQLLHRPHDIGKALGRKAVHAALDMDVLRRKLLEHVRAEDEQLRRRIGHELHLERDLPDDARRRQHAGVPVREAVERDLAPVVREHACAQAAALHLDHAEALPVAPVHERAAVILRQARAAPRKLALRLGQVRPEGQLLERRGQSFVHIRSPIAAGHTAALFFDQHSTKPPPMESPRRQFLASFFPHPARQHVDKPAAERYDSSRKHAAREGRAMRALCYAQTNIGSGRDNNEDNYYCNGTFKRDPAIPVAEAAAEQESRRLIYGVFDGMGGEANGEQAALLCAQTLHQCSDEPFDALDFFRRANVAVCDMIAASGQIGGSTAATVHLTGNRAYCCNVGDSRIYLQRGGALQRISRDHTKYQEQLDAGAAAADAADNPDRHVLTQYLGMLGARQRLMPYFAASVPLAVGDRLLLCTDGLTGKLSDSQLQAALGADLPLPELGQALMAQALAAGPGDNITLVLIEITALDAETAVPLPQPPAEELSQTRRFEVPAARIAEQETQRKKHAHARRREIILTVAVVLAVLAAVIAALWLAVGSIPRKHPAPASTPVQTVAPTPTPASVNPPQIILPPPPTPEPEPTPEITPEPSPDTTHVPETAAPENLPG